MYGGVLKIEMQVGMKLIVFADDVALVGIDSDMEELTLKMDNAMDEIGGWLDSRRLELAPEKTETTLLKFARRNRDFGLTCRQLNIESSRIVKYLGVISDTSVTFGPKEQPMRSAQYRRVGRLQEKDSLLRSSIYYAVRGTGMGRGDESQPV